MKREYTVERHGKYNAVQGLVLKQTVFTRIQDRKDFLRKIEEAGVELNETKEAS